MQALILMMEQQNEERKGSKPDSLKIEGYWRSARKERSQEQQENQTKLSVFCPAQSGVFYFPLNLR